MWKKHFIAALLIAALSVGVGFGYDFIATLVEKKTHPRPFAGQIKSASDEFGVPEEIIYAVMKTESGFNAGAVSPKGAVGLMQIMPETFDWLLTKTGEEIGGEKLAEPSVNIRYGVCFLSILFREFASWDTVYAAYNAGITRVKSWLADERYSEGGFLTAIPFGETDRYVIKVNDAVKVYKKLYKY